MTTTKMEQLQKIVDQIGGGSDPEVDHSNGDWDLCEVIRILSEGTDYEEVAKEIVSSWDAMTKWYA